MSDEIIEDKPIEQEVTLRDDIKNAFAEANARDAERQKPDVEVHKEAEAAAGKPRAEDGKFAAKPKPEEKTYSAPNSWSNEEKAKWALLPPDVQAIVDRREKETEKFATRADEERTLGKSIREAVTPYMATIQAEGGNPVEGFKQYLNTAHVLRTGTPQQKAKTLLEIGKQFGADFSVLNGQPQQFDPTPIVQQQVQAQMAKLEEQRQAQEAQRMIADFKADPANIHFETLKPYMHALMTAQPPLAMDLKDAYDKALAANPETRSTLMQAATADNEAQRIAAAKSKAENARKAASSVVGSPGATAGNPVVENRTLREELRANLRAAQIH